MSTNSQQPVAINQNPSTRLSLVIAGHVDHGKSTVIGRLLADTNSLPTGKLDMVRANCERNSKPFEYAFLLDALKDEQSQGITIDSARIFFKSKKREYIIIDAPGHIEFLKNMISGAARAEAALLVIDAAEGVRENSRRHGYMLSMLGIRQITVLVNKMDLADFDKARFDSIEKEYRAFLTEVGIVPLSFIPIAARDGVNIASRATKEMPWYSGDTVLDALDRFQKEALPLDKPFRMPVQDVYKFTAHGDDRRIVAGTIETGRVRVGQDVIFYPSGKHSTIKTIEGFNTPQRTESEAGQAAGFTLTEQIYVKRGEIAVLSSDIRPKVSSRIKVSLFWLGKKPMVMKRDYFLKLGTAKISCRLEAVHKLIDASTLDSRQDADRINRHDVAECTIKLSKPMAFDLADTIAATSRFVIIDDYEITGGGIIREDLPDGQGWVREKVFLRNYKWEQSSIQPERRAVKYNQRPTLLIMTGPKSAGKKTLARALEADLFNDGRIVYFLGIGNVIYGIDADIKGKSDTREEHLRRLGEVAHIMLESGAILIVTAVELTQADLEIIKTCVASEQIEVVWMGDYRSTDVTPDLMLPTHPDAIEGVAQIKDLLVNKNIIFRPW
ncbi:MAG: adenylyl-sulfate kinase [Bacteroidetes bacterium]|nr:adenylyl-sulfate kinase [Bacteroidota bacterium]